MWVIYYEKNNRSFMVNMMIHSDYMITGVLKIVKEEKGFLFSNPGSLKLPIRRIYEGGNSKARNPRIQTMLRMIGYGDKQNVFQIIRSSIWPIQSPDHVRFLSRAIHSC